MTLPTKRRMKMGGTKQVRDDSMMTAQGLQELYARMDEQIVIARGKIALMEEGPERLEASLMLLALVNKQDQIANQIDLALGRKK